ncbi:MAG: hypothetical protein ACLFRT_03035 [Actinomycetota bacterium]
MRTGTRSMLTSNPEVSAVEEAAIPFVLLAKGNRAVLIPDT